MVETINKLNRTQKDLIQELGREPSALEIAEAMNKITAEKNKGGKMKKKIRLK